MRFDEAADAQASFKLSRRQNIIAAATSDDSKGVRDKTVSKAIGGICRDGKAELLGTPPDVAEARVVVTFLTGGEIDLEGRWMSEAQAADLRARLRTFAEGRERPEMGAYDAL